MSQALLRLPAVSARVGFGRSSIYAKVKKGEFPAPIQIGARVVAWPSAEIDAWIAARIVEARAAPAAKT